MKIYLAGKIAKNDWRGKLVPAVRNTMPEEWRETKTLDTITSDEYVGPFFVSCDHGCAHGGNKHGSIGAECCGSEISREDVLAKSLAGIEACELFIVRADSEFQSAYGTIAEIGAAHALGKAIVIIRQINLPESAFHNVWFPFACADMVLDAPGPVEVIETLLLFISRLKDYRGTTKNLLQTIHRFYEPRLNQVVNVREQSGARQAFQVTERTKGRAALSTV